MAGSWLRGVVGVSLTLCVAGQALAAEGKVTVFAAASLTNAMQDIAQAMSGPLLAGKMLDLGTGTVGVMAASAPGIVLAGVAVFWLMHRQQRAAMV